jgi:hypothetical protein
MAVDQIIAAAKQLSSLHAFITKGELADLIGEIELEAAKDALHKSKIAKDTKSQVWSAVNHLEAAHVSFEKQYRGKGRGYNLPGRVFQLDNIAAKDRWCLFLMATCYAYLEEYQLFRMTIEKARHAKPDNVETIWAEPFAYPFAILALSLDLRIWYQFYLSESIPSVTDKQITELEEAALSGK